MYKNFSLGIFFLLLLVEGVGQQNYTISGYVKDASNGEALTGATVYTKENMKGTVANAYGFYSLTVARGEYTLEVTFVGYEKYTVPINLSENIRRNIELSPIQYQMEEVVVSASRGDANVSSTEMGTTELRIEAIKKTPSFFGEADLMKTVQLLPGVQSSGEGSSGYYVRGGGIDQNLILLDDAVIYNAGHLFGFFSIFNADAVRSAEMIKAGMPANYGGRLASVLNVSMKEGNMKKYEAEGGIGIIFARLNVQGPIVKNKASFLLTGRRTYVDKLIQPFLRKDSPAKGLKLYFYDLNGKVNWRINDKHHLFLSGYHGSDAYGFKSSEGSMYANFAWQNSSASFRWNYNISSKLFLNTSFMFSDYQFNTEIEMDVYKLKIFSGIRDYSAKTELTYLPIAGNIFHVGGMYTFHRITPNTYAAEATSMLEIPQSPVFNTHEAAIYANDEIDLGEAIRLTLGVRGSYFQHTGAFTSYTPDEVGRIGDSVIYGKGEKVKDFWGIEPRASVRFSIDKTFSIKASYMHNYQYLHQVTMSSISLPTDMWMASTTNIKPQIGNQYSVGVYKNILKDMYEFSIELYYKDMKNQTEYKAGYSPITEATKYLEQQYTQGDGYSYGAEFFVNKTYGKFTGWIGYTLSWTRRIFPELNNGKEYPAHHDRRHDISVMLSYEILPQLTTSIVWVYATGNTMTIPLGFYFMGYDMVTEYSEKNAFRVPPYHRMDISVNWVIKKTERFENSLNFSVYNVYNRRNPFFISIGSQLDQTKGEITNTAYQMSLFPIIPSITWNFKFK
ncbi:MAG: TonB-dependent receptor [Bacteroidales bacterium]|jgi:outer membrane receptor for ferrienterochelin and colicin|nr:TonB-dependent receptor [Bacteroidales bacterium]